MLKRIGFSLRCWFLVVGLFLLLLGCVREEQQTSKGMEELSNKEHSTETEIKIAKFTNQLGADDWLKREEAEKALRKIGIPVEPYLKKVFHQDPEPEIAMRIKRLLSRIEVKKQGRIAFIKTVGKFPLGPICIMDADGKDIVNLTRHIRCFYLCWSPDGKNIAFVAHDNNFEIYTMDAEGKKHQEIN